jgi:hypothetical protein
MNLPGRNYIYCTTFGGNMRSDQIHLAIAQGHNRFEICKMTSKSVQMLHKQGERMEDSINRALGLLRSDAAAAAAELGA